MRDTKDKEYNSFSLLTLGVYVVGNSVVAVGYWLLTLAVLTLKVHWTHLADSTVQPRVKKQSQLPVMMSMTAVALGFQSVMVETLVYLLVHSLEHMLDRLSVSPVYSDLNNERRIYFETHY